MATCLQHVPHLISFSPYSLFFPCPFRHFLPHRQSHLPSFLTARVTPLPSMKMWRSHSLLCCIAFARGHRETAENLCWYSRPFNGVCSLWKMTSRSVFRCAGRGPAVTHPSTDPAISCLTWVIAWHRPPTTHWILSVIKVIVTNVLYAK